MPAGTSLWHLGHLFSVIIIGTQKEHQWAARFIPQPPEFRRRDFTLGLRVLRPGCDWKCVPIMVVFQARGGIRYR